MIRPTLLLSLTAVTVWAVNDDTPINAVPMVYAHDSATGYIDKSNIVLRWTQTQNVSMAGQLSCGARVLDARPQLDDEDGLVWHHGPVKVDHSFADSMDEIVAWCGQHPDELVLAWIWDCVGGDACDEAVAEVLTERNITATNTDCTVWDGMTLGEAKALAALPNGGKFLAITDGCCTDNYDETLDCHGWTNDQGARVGTASDVAWTQCLDSSEGSPDRCAGILGYTKYSCWDDDPTSTYPRGRLFDNLDAVAAAGPLDDGTFWQMQSIWQESVEDVVGGVFEFSSLLEDEVQSRVNSYMLEAVQDGRWASVGWLGLNNVCDQGAAIYDALQARY